MRPTFLGMETAKSAAFTNQKALDIVGNNLSNMNTNGYTRQRVDVNSLAAGAYTSRVANSRVGLAGLGVEAQGVSQLRDSFLDKRFRDEYSKSSYHAQASDILADIETALSGNDVTDGNGLGGALEKIFESLQAYQEPSQKPSDTQANLVMSAFRNITQVLNALDSKLKGVASQQTTDLGLDVDRINEIFVQVADLNKMISGDVTVATNPNNEHYRPNELMDQRNLLLDELAGYGDIKTTERADGTVTVDMGGYRAVDGGVAKTLRLGVSDDQTVSLRWSTTGENVQITEGALLARVEYLNGRGNNIQGGNETSQKGIPYYHDRLNTFSSALAQIANNTIPELDAEGKVQFKKDANGNTEWETGADGVRKEKILYKTLLATSRTDGTGTVNHMPVTASNIAMSDEWNNGGPGYFIYNRGEYNYDHAIQLGTELVSKEHRFQAYGESFVGTFEDYNINCLTSVGTDVAFQTGRRDATAKVADDLLVRRDETSGVSRDEETAVMLQYQKSYEAAARLMTTMDDILDVVINRMGRVGL